MAKNKKIISKIYKSTVVCIMVYISMFVSIASSVYQTANAATIKDFFNNLFSASTSGQQLPQLPVVYLGGIPLGFTLECNGVIVVAVGQVHTSSGAINTVVSGKIETGDIITKINGENITSYQTIEEQMVNQEKENNQVSLDVLDRQSNAKQVTILPAKDVITGKYKLGLWVRDNSAGVGTLTYVREDNKVFGALGHSVCDIDTGRELPLLTGNVYKCNIIGVSPSKQGNAGELKGLFLKSGNIIGDVKKNLYCGVFGTANDGLVNLLNKKVQVAAKSQVKTGRASIFCCVDGTQAQEYSIEIIKTVRSNKENNKSMIVRITDDRLIEKTGGIVQGMSGSPIVQNGMLVGAITHVFINDPTKGYGIFAQTMIENGD